ncbi:hypothetical protein BBJ28_00025645, partial [Nothophytophthora sp. Chile5]
MQILGYWTRFSACGALDAADLLQDGALQANEILYELVRMARCETEMNRLAVALTRVDFPELHGIEPAQRHKVRFLKFVRQLARRELPRASPWEAPLSSLEILVGKDINDWIGSAWERQWQIYSDSEAARAILGDTDAWIDEVERMLHGISIPQTDSLSVNAKVLGAAAFLLALNAEDIVGVRHGVDVTLVNHGGIHPVWSGGDGKTESIACEEVMAAFEDGYTIGIRSAQARSLAIAQFCSALQRDLQQHVNANIYCDPISEPPVLYQDIEGLSELSPEASTKIVLLQPGQVLYVPRGVPHCADTKGMAEDSIHLTVGVELESRFTMKTLVLEILESCMEEGTALDATVTEKASMMELIHATISTEGCRNLMNSGVMAWHIETSTALSKLVACLLATIESSLDSREASEALENIQAAQSPNEASIMDYTRSLIRSSMGKFSEDSSKLSAMRAALDEKRKVFLDSREYFAQGFALLQETLHYTEDHQVCHMYSNIRRIKKRKT